MQGASGAQGDAGVQGAPGVTGATGSQGNTGAQGSQGATGTQGPQGTQGFQGSQGSGANTVIETSTGPTATSILGANATSSASVSCPSNFPFAVGGGFSGTEASFPNYSTPTGGSTTSPATGWQASLTINSGSIAATVYVICST